MFQANYKVNRIILVEAILLPYCRRIMFLFCRIIPYPTIQKNLGKKSIKTSRIFKEIYGAVPSVSSCQNSNLVLRVIFKKQFFRLPLLAIRCAGNEVGQNSSIFYLYKKHEILRKGLQQRSYSSKVKHIKIYPDIMIKTSRLHH